MWEKNRTSHLHSNKSLRYARKFCHKNGYNGWPLSWTCRLLMGKFPKVRGEARINTYELRCPLDSLRNKSLQNRSGNLIRNSSDYFWFSLQWKYHKSFSCGISILLLMASDRMRQHRCSKIKYTWGNILSEHNFFFNPTKTFSEVWTEIWISSYQ